MTTAGPEPAPVMSGSIDRQLPSILPKIGPGDRPERPRWALVLGGGAARGIAHVGVLRVLERAGLRPDMIVGTSVGAMVGAFLASGVSADRLAALGETIRWSDMARPVVNRYGLLSNDRLGSLMRRVLPVRTFGELEIPFACTATELASSELVLLCEGELASAVRASCAIPGMVVPVKRDGRRLMDGGVVENLPTRSARLLGAELVIAVNVNRSFERPQPPRHMFSVVMHSFFTLGRVADQRANTDADLLITPDVGDVGFDQLDRHDELLWAGEQAGRQALAELRRLVTRRPMDEASSTSAPGLAA